MPSFLAASMPGARSLTVVLRSLSARLAAGWGRCQILPAAGNAPLEPWKCLHWSIAVAFVIGGFTVRVAPAADGPPGDLIKHFETTVRPVLVEHCLKCHGPEKQWGSLRLDSREAMLKGGDTGPAIIVGQPDESLMIRAIRHLDAELKMPPPPKNEKLSDKQIADLAAWIKSGAVYPGTKAVSNRHRDPSHWAFQPPRSRAAPGVNRVAWPHSSLDQFLLAKIEAAGLEPAKIADRRTLIRRATFDLTGLPPTPDEVSDFLNDPAQDAFDRLIDRLLASPAYGERWGRHWLDVARYADSNGLDENVAHGNAWRYRDYVVESLNRDTPYNQFLVEQLAGDLIPWRDDFERNRNLVATGFLALGPKVLAEVDEVKMQMDIVDEQIDTVGRALLGMTFGCARCHDHKFDPIDTADYYGLAGIFKSTRTMEHFKKVAKWHENPLNSPEAAARKSDFDAQVARKRAAINDVIAEADARVKSQRPEGATPAEKPETQYPAETRAELKRLRDELAQFEKQAPDLPSAMGVQDDQVVDVAIHIRGNPLKLGEIVPRRIPRILAERANVRFSPSESGRMELVRSLIAEDHPLTGRVIVNRVWRWHFGKGLVRNPDNFGLLGEAPSHPELLDWLAIRFVGDGWSLKKLHRLMVLSAAYQQDSHAPAQSLERDPENRLFGRADLRRLEAEEIRDSLLAVSDSLDPSLGGSLLTVKNRAYFFDHTSKDLTDYSSRRRSIYLPVVRNNVYDMFQLLDYPDAAIPTGDRPTTTVAPQALMMLNSDFMARISAAMSESLASECGGDESARLRRVYVKAYGREPSTAELEENRQFLARVEQQFAKLDPIQQKARAWECLCQTILASNEFIYVE